MKQALMSRRRPARELMMARPRAPTYHRAVARAHAQPDCVFCGYREAPVHLQRPRFVVRRCPHCRVLWCDPTRLADEPEPAPSPTPSQQGSESDAVVHTDNAGRLHQLMHHAGPDSHPRLLAIGSVPADFVDQARGAGYEARSLADPAGLSELDEASLDVIAAFDRIERLQRPERFLDASTRALRTGGVLIAETPAQESIYHHVLFMRGRVRPEAELDIGVRPGGRVFAFGRRSWEIILRDRDYEILEAAPRSTPMRELLARKRDSPLLRAGIVGLGLLGRVTGWQDRVLVVARSLGERFA